MVLQGLAPSLDRRVSVTFDGFLVERSRFDYFSGLALLPGTASDLRSRWISIAKKNNVAPMWLVGLRNELSVMLWTTMINRKQSTKPAHSKSTASARCAARHEDIQEAQKKNQADDAKFYKHV